MAPFETSADVTPEPVAALCERVRAIAQAAGEEGLRSRRERADALVVAARQRVAEDTLAERGRAEEQRRKWSARELQSARMQARALEASARWAELDAVLDEAEHEVGLIRLLDPERYAAALARFLQAARDQLAAPRVRVEANAADIRLLGDVDGELIQGEVGAGIVVTTPDGNCVCDQTIASRRRRLDGELRLAAAEILFPVGDEPPDARPR